ncbi:DUF485 domain-containing protein [Brevibacillus dissolubilis]|uniref:DUF485 domain-containing protein n=1 Tax=Brevibacillus dissolubilis TaxID=1844116 RepID=UPI001115ED5B|nr:DUF485 domain-containing protein [Brevibacillus dissolubilis]
MATKKAIRQENAKPEVDYTAVVQSASFQKLLHDKRAFILPMSVFFFVFYFTLPVMTAFFPVLDAPAVGAISWAWVFGIAQFIMTWIFCMVYSSKARKFDEDVEQIKAEMAKGGASR